MPTDYENGVRKTIDITVQAAHLTEDILRSCMQQVLNGSAEKKGLMTYKALQDKSGRLDSVELNKEDMARLVETAAKYDLDIAVKLDKSTDPPTQHIFFSAARTEDFQRAFSEFVSKKNADMDKLPRGEMSREQTKQESKEIAKQPKKEKVRQRFKEVSH